MAMIWSYSPNR